MTRTKTLIIVLLTLLVASLPTLAQSTLGNMFKLGGSTTANLPASSSYTVGALIYDLDAGTPLYNNGSSWQSFGGGGSGGFWYDGGAGFIQAAETLGVSTAATPVRIARAAVTSNGGYISDPTLQVDSALSTTAAPAIRANLTWNPGYGGNRGSELQLGYNGAYATQVGGWYSAAESAYLTGICTNQANAPYSGSAIRFAIGSAGGNMCGDTTFNLSSGEVRFDINNTDVATFVPFKLATYNDAGIPSASGRTGAVVYNTSQGAPVWSDGTSWQSFGGGGSGGDSSVWIDAGSFYNTPSVKLIPPSDGGQTFWYVSNYETPQPSIAINPKTTFGTLPSGFVMAHTNNYPVGFTFTNSAGFPPGYDMSSQYGMWYSPGSGIYHNGDTPWTEFNVGLNIGSSSASSTMQPISFIGMAPNTGGRAVRFAYFHNSGSSGSGSLQGLHIGGQYADSSGRNGVEFEYTSTRFDLGAGTNDYCASDGTGIETPSYWESTRAFTAGPGLVSNGMNVTATATASFTSGNTANYSVGAIAMDSTRGLVNKRIADSAGLNPMGETAKHVVYDQQTYTMRLTASGSATHPDFAEHTMVNSGKKLSLYWTDTETANVRKADNRTYYPLTVVGEATKRVYSVEDSLTTFLPFLHTDSAPTFCQRISMDSSVSDITVWTGLTAVLTDGTSTLPGKGIAFRYVAGTDTNWQLCASNGGSQTCIDTGSEVKAEVPYVLCFNMNVAAGAVYGYVDGDYVGTISTNLPSGATLGYDTAIKSAAGGTHILNVGPFHLGSF